MGNNHVTATSPTRTTTMKDNKSVSSIKRNSDKEKFLRIKFQDISRKYHFLINNEIQIDIEFLQREFRKIFQIPSELKMSFFIKENGLKFELDEKTFINQYDKLIHISKIEENNLDDYLIEVEILRIQEDSYQTLRFQTFDFFPMRTLILKSKERRNGATSC